MSTLKIMAHDQDDVTSMSALLQDATFMLKDLIYDPKGRFVQIVMRRFCHEKLPKTMRTQSGLRLDGVLSLRFRGLDLSKREQIHSLLSIDFIAHAEAPAGALIFHLASLDGQAPRALKIEVEAIDLLLCDQGAPKIVRKRPDHQI